MSLQESFVVEEGHSEPKFRQVSKHIESLVKEKVLKPGARLPSEKDLASQFGITAVTVSRGLHELVRKGLLVRKVGSGTYVSRGFSFNNGHDTPKIGLLCHYPPEGDWYASSVANMVHTALEKHKFDMISVVARKADYLRVAENNKLSGLIVVAPLLDFRPQLEKVLKENYPFIIIGSIFPGLEDHCYSIDDMDAGKQAVEYLHKIGHRNIGMVTGPVNDSASQDRLKGFQEGMWEAQLATNPAWTIGFEPEKAIDPKNLVEKIKEVLRPATRPTALFAVGYNQALAIYKAAKSLELSIPNDISVLGFDDPVSAEHLSPPLTTFCQPIDTIVENAMEAFMERICSKDSQNIKEAFHAKLIERESCATIK